MTELTEHPDFSTENL